MKEATVVLVALLVVPACLAAGEAPLPAATEDPGLLPAVESCSAETSADTQAVEAALFTPGEETKAQRGGCPVICHCFPLRTEDVTRVGATCTRARQRAAAAARELAVCPPDSEGHCGPTTHNVDACERIPTGGFSATARAFYQCEFCEEICQ